LIGQGQSYKQMADTLKLSIPTLVTYRTRLLDRLQLTHTDELVAYAREHEPTMPTPVIRRGRSHTVVTMPSPVMPPSLPIVYMPRVIEQREEWPG
jgi:hypothetical protein